MSEQTYPVRVGATLQEPLSRWLWLVKWVLVIPHYVVLTFLWLAFVVLTAVAAVAILFTGRYPRGIFDFNVGVLRWSWRVGYYAYSGLGTDQYPPFSLAERADYPAHLEVAYPEQLSRGLVLVKWWLLALPHYIVVGLFVGGGWYVGRGVEDRYPAVWQGGLIGILVLVAAVVLLFTGRYPRSIFDFVLGLNRWVLRVAAYAGLMTDDYPPFRLDTGGEDPGGPPALRVGAPQGPELDAGPDATGAPAGDDGRARWGAGRVLGAVAGSLLVLLSLGLLLGAGGARLADSVARDSSGYLMSETAHYTSPGYAATSEPVTFGFTRWPAWPQRWLGTVKVSVDAGTANGAFVGLARTSAVDDYLRGVARTRMSFEGDRVLARHFTDGTSPRTAPTEQRFWAASTSGPGHRTLTWQPRAGDWTLVVMNGEGTTPVSADVSVGATLPVLRNAALVLLVSGLVVLALGGALLALVLARRSS
ncbi:MAG TPA: DUF4389 domain-containing protein [Marmoricola sp.]|nr:DUF4389 domain-containing protein [Marmoricola sp.]